MDEILDSGFFTKYLKQVSMSRLDSLGIPAKYLMKLISIRIMLDTVYDWILANNRNSPFFLMINSTNAHYPWALPLDVLVKQVGFNIVNIFDPELITIRPYQYNSGKKQVTDKYRKLWQLLYDGSIIHLDREMVVF
jgi:hypothetical protein